MNTEFKTSTSLPNEERASDIPLSDQSEAGYYNYTRPESLALVPSAAQRILDIGCGAGVLGLALKRRQNAEVHGVEIVPAVAEEARVCLDRVWNCKIEQALSELKNGYYDCIVIADVLEHLVDPWVTLALIKAKLSTTGVLVASIPNIQNWGALADLIEGKWTYRRDGILDRTHLRFFTRRSVRELFWGAGLKIRTLATTNRGPTPPASLLDALQSAGLADSALRQDGPTWQFLVCAVHPPAQRDARVCTIILNWNGKADTRECLQSIQQTAYSNLDVVVVDNGSTDNSVAELRSQFPSVHFIETGKNLGYAGGNNVGVAWAMEHGADYVFILNNDTVVDPKCIGELLHADQIADVGVLGPTSFYFSYPDKIWAVGATRASSPIPGYRLIGDGDEASDWPRLSIMDGLVGSAMLIRRDVFTNVGLLDETFFLCWEEFDFCARANAAGYFCLHVPSAKIRHKVGSALGDAESPMRIYFNTRNRLLWAKKQSNRVGQAALRRQTLSMLRRILLPRIQVSDGVMKSPKRLFWVLRSWWALLRRNTQDPANRARLYAVRDYFLGRFGDCPAAVRALPRRASSTVPNART